MGTAHAELVEFLRNAETFEILFDQESGHTTWASFQIIFGVHHQYVSVRAIGDPHLGAVQHPAVAFKVCAQFHADDIGTGIRLGHRERTDVFTGNQFRQVFLFLLFCTVAFDLVHAQIRVGTVRQANGSRGA